MTARCDAVTTSEVYAQGADAYDEAWSPVILPAAAAVVRRLDIATAMRVLDVGAGTGALTPILRAAAPNASIVSVDPAWEMLRFAAARRHVTAALADATALPITDGTADAVLLAYVLFMLADPARGLREATRVLRPGGRVGTVTWKSEEQSVAARTWDATLDELGVPKLPAHSNHTGLDTADNVESLLTAAGLVRCDVWHETIDHTFEPDHFWRLRTAHGVNGVRLARLDKVRRERVLAELHDRLSALAPSDYQHCGTLVCAVAQKPTEENDEGKS
jgi:ubiquinone/menaquinone biosynthesis C-methylase UbiE